LHNNGKELNPIKVGLLREGGEREIGHHQGRKHENVSIIKPHRLLLCKTPTDDIRYRICVSLSLFAQGLPITNEIKPIFIMHH
jgi:hypothetical protein